ncbi:MAG: class I SAM-dependent methyltransferase [Rhodobacteraceae bacterium]|nr:class I SAM-dependent methyltransferase [Paracoccaceae bacterium]
MPVRSVPGSASVAAQEGEKLFAPSAARNAAAITELLLQIAPAEGRALELASGTGQHVVAFATAMPALSWQPSEADPIRMASVDSYARDAGQPNIRPALQLDATAPGWGQRHAGQTLIVLSNLLHLISDAEAETLIAEAALALAPGGRLVIYGPFMRGDELTSEGDQQFHASLTAHDPEIGYKDDFDTMDLMQEAGLEMVQVVEMPANNLALVAEKPAF